MLTLAVSNKNLTKESLNTEVYSYRINTVYYNHMVKQTKVGINWRSIKAEFEKQFQKFYDTMYNEAKRYPDFQELRAYEPISEDNIITVDTYIIYEGNIAEKFVSFIFSYTVKE